MKDKQLVGWESFVIEDVDKAEESLTGYVEIFKEGTDIEEEEWKLIEETLGTSPNELPGYENEDYYALDLTGVTNDFNVADELVNKLNELSESKGAGIGEWFVADPTIELVHL